MFGLVRTAVRFFLIGLGTGVLLAPRSGAETRAMIRERLRLVTDGLLDIAGADAERQGAARPRDAEGGQASTRRGSARRATGSGARAED